MKRWLMVVSPAVAIAVVGILLVLLTDRDTQPLPPLASPVIPTPTLTPITGPTGTNGLTGSPGLSGSSGPTEAALPTTPGPSPTNAGGLGPTGASGGQVDGSGETVSVGLVLMKEPAAASQVVEAKIGQTIVISAKSVDVTDNLYIRGFERRVAVSPGTAATIELEVTEAGTFGVYLESSGVLVAELVVSS